MTCKKLISVLLVIAVLALLLAACAENPLKAASGTYKGQYTKLVGDDTHNEEEFSLTLNDDGTGKHARDDMEFDVTWTLEGENFSMKETFLGMSIDYTGTLKDGALHLYNGDPSDIWTYEYFYEKQ